MTPDLSWIDQAANGDSFRVPRNYDRDQLVPDDRIAGVVTAATATSLVISVQQGSYRGEELEVGSWWRVRTFGVGVLTRWRERDEPGVGDRVVLTFRSHERNQAIRFDCGMAPREVVEAAAWE